MSSIRSTPPQFGSSLSGLSASPEPAPAPPVAGASTAASTQDQATSTRPASAREAGIARRLRSFYKTHDLPSPAESLPDPKKQRVSTRDVAHSMDVPSASRSRLEQLPQEVHLNIFGHLQQAHPKSLLSAALASKTMHASAQASGKLKAERLKRQMLNTCRDLAPAYGVVEQIIAEAKDGTIPLTSEDRLAIIQNVLPENVTASSARDIVELVESLNPEHQAKAILGACRCMPNQTSPANVELFDRLADIVESFRTVEERSTAIHLLEHFYKIPESERLTRFDRLAPMWEAIQNEQEKAKGSNALFSAVDTLPLQARHDRFTRYADAPQAMQDAAAKATVVFMQARCLWYLPQDHRRHVFDKLVSHVASIPDGNAKQKVVEYLKQASQTLLPDEREEALASIPT